jgi:L-arabinose isomerase
MAMNDAPKARVGLLGLMLELYEAWPELRPTMAGFAQELAEVLAPFADVAFPGVCNTREQVDQAVAGFEGDGRDLIIVVLLTYAPSHIALPALCRTRLPILIFNTQRLDGITAQISSEDTTENHGMHGVQDLANVLLRAGRSFDIVTGYYQDATTLGEVKAWCEAARAVRVMRHMRIGLLGYPMEGMGDFGIDETALLAQVGVQVHHVPMRAVAERAQAAPADAVAYQMAEDRQLFQFPEGISQAEHEASSRLEWALREVLCEGEMRGFASHFIAVGEEARLDTQPFLAAAKLLADGYGFGGEGDVTSAAAVALMSELAGAANFTEMFSMDFAGNAALMMHMGEGNWKMARRDEPIHLVRSDLGLFAMCYTPLLLGFSLEPGEVTLLSLTTTHGGRLKFVVTEGEVLDFPYVPALARPHYKFRPRGDLRSFLTRFSKEGGSHHQALAYGRWAATLEKLAVLLGIEYACV